MNKETKKNYIEEMKKIFTVNESVMIAHYQGLNVVQLDALRKELRENDIMFKVTKNRITKLAVKDSPCKELEKFLTGPTAVAISSDPFMSARILSKFAKKMIN
jgi:large subunit ribosomal protein L10